MGKGWKKGYYCTLFPDKLFGVYYGDICYEHDLDYSSERDTEIRKIQDEKLRKGVYNKFKLNNKKFLGIIISNLMYAACRLLGRFYWKKW